MRQNPLLVHWSAPALALALVACTHVRPPSLPVVASEAPVGDNTLALSLQPNGRGTIALTIRWPERARATQVIPLRTNSLVIQIRASDDRVLASQTLTRPPDGSTEVTANLEVPANRSFRLHVAAFQEETPAFDSVPIAEGTSNPVSVEPSQEATVRIALRPTAGPVITSLPTSGGPLSFMAIQGQHFDGWGGPIRVTFGGIASPVVVGSDTELRVLVPDNAVDGPITVTADGITVTSAETFRIIRSMSLSPASSVTTVGTPLLLEASARDASGALIPSPIVTWRYDSLSFPAGIPSEPITTLEAGEFIPGSTGSFEVRVSAGSIWATASVTVN